MERSEIRDTAAAFSASVIAAPEWTGRHHLTHAEPRITLRSIRATGPAETTSAMSFIGKSVTRLEDRPLVTGRGAYAADISFPRQLHMRVVRSAVAHGRIVSIGAAEARAVRGVVAVWTSADVTDIPPIDFRLTRMEGLLPYRQPVLARDRVRYVGEPVAAVFATDAYVAEDAADLVAVDIETLPPVLAADAPPGEFEPGRSTEAGAVEKHYGEVERAFHEA